MATPTRAQVEAALSRLPADQHAGFLAEVRRRMGESDQPSRGLGGPSVAVSAAPERGLVDAARDWLAGVASDRRIAQQDRQEAREAGIGLTPTTGEMVGAAGAVAAVPAVASNPALAVLALGGGLAGSRLGGELGYAAGEQVAPGVGSLGEEAGSAVGGFAGGAAPYGARAAIRTFRGRGAVGAPDAPPAGEAAPQGGRGPAREPVLPPELEAVVRDVMVDALTSMLPGGALVRGAGGALLRRAGRGAAATAPSAAALAAEAATAAPVAATPAAASARALLDFAARSGAKPGSKVWIALDASGAPTRVLTADQARAAARAGEAVTWVRNVGDPIAAATRRKAAEQALQGLGVTAPTP